MNMKNRLTYHSTNDKDFKLAFAQTLGSKSLIKSHSFYIQKSFFSQKTFFKMQLLGAGGYGATYQFREISSEEEVAVKVIKIRNDSELKGMNYSN
jgi:hypothetical protein